MNHPGEPSMTAEVGRPASEIVRCPTCGASQAWSPECRRCRSDLRLLQEAASQYRLGSRRCLRELRSGRPRAAFEHARACLALSPDDETRKLAAVCALLAGDWPSARDLGLNLA